jgi:hypothetical protein
MLATPEKLSRVLLALVGDLGGEPKEGEPGPLERVRVRSMAFVLSKYVKKVRIDEKGLGKREEGTVVELF